MVAFLCVWLVFQVSREGLVFIEVRHEVAVATQVLDIDAPEAEFADSLADLFVLVVGQCPVKEGLA
jgi:hypothetical protein